MDICSKKNQINDILQDIFKEYNRMNETKIQSKCESDLEMRNMISTIRDLETSETNKIKINQELEDEIRSLKRQICEYELMINDLQSKLEIADEEEQENNKFDILRIQAKEITMKDIEIDRLNKLIKYSKENNKENKNNTIDEVFEKVSINKKKNKIKISEKDNEIFICESKEVKNKDKDKDKDKGKLLKITYKKIKYHVYENENPQYIYEFNNEKKADKVLGIRTKNEKGKYKIQLN